MQARDMIPSDESVTEAAIPGLFKKGRLTYGSPGRYLWGPSFMALTRRMERPSFLWSDGSQVLINVTQAKCRVIDD